MKSPISILIVEDDALQAAMLAGLLKKWGYTYEIAPNGDQALHILPTRPFQMALVDMMMPGMDGLTLLTHLKTQAPHMPVIMLTGQQEVSAAVAAMRGGAFDYLTKPYDPARLRITIDHAQELTHLKKAAARAKWADLNDLTFDDLIGGAGALAPSVTIARKVAGTDLPVLILGETGVGKEVFARALHGESARATKPFIAINCGAIPEHLIESILFGHEKGAFTGATERTLGKFREAEGGTIFLDEIGEMPLAAQIRLLRVLQQGTIEPVGGTREIPVNVRILSATHRDLQADVARGRFREDLFYRLNVVPITLPPLRQRRNDLPDLIAHFIERYHPRTGPARHLSPAALEKIGAHPWPGNVRQLENTLRRSLILADHAELGADDILIDHDMVDLAAAMAQGAPSRSPAHPTETYTIQCRTADGGCRTLFELEQEILKTTLQVHQGNITAAARDLGIAKSTYYRRLAMTETE